MRPPHSPPKRGFRGQFLKLKVHPRLFDLRTDHQNEEKNKKKKKKNKNKKNKRRKIKSKTIVERKNKIEHLQSYF